MDEISLRIIGLGSSRMLVLFFAFAGMALVGATTVEFSDSIGGYRGTQYDPFRGLDFAP